MRNKTRRKKNHALVEAVYKKIKSACERAAGEIGNLQREGLYTGNRKIRALLAASFYEAIALEVEVKSNGASQWYTSPRLLVEWILDRIGSVPKKYAFEINHILSLLGSIEQRYIEPQQPCAIQYADIAGANMDEF